MTHAELIELMQQQLHNAYTVSALDITDDGADHRGHAHEGAGHFTVNIVSADFAGKSLVARHQMIYKVLGQMVGREIHALRIHAKTPDEV